MNCPNCNYQIDSSQMYCPNCGSKQNQHVYPGVQQTQQQYPGVQQTQQQYPGAQQIQQQYPGTQSVQAILENTEADNEEVLINAYIGRNEDKLKSGFSFCCLFIGVFYPLYRKMWAFAGIWYCINYIVAIIFPNTGFVGRIINVFAAIIFKELYVKTVNKRVNKIKDNNPGKTQAELIGICARKGGTTILGPILGILVVFTVAFTIAYIEILLS